MGKTYTIFERGLVQFIKTNKQIKTKKQTKQKKNIQKGYTTTVADATSTPPLPTTTKKSEARLSNQKDLSCPNDLD